MVRMTVRIVDPLDRHLTEIALQKGISKNALIVEACWEFLAKKSKEWHLEEDKNESKTKN